MGIPKIIHYCWLGPGQGKPELIAKCIYSWKLLDGYTIKEWNEETFDVSDHPFTCSMYAQGKFAFVSDYIRLKALYEFGGIYLDTDVEIKKKLDDAILSHRMFISFQYDCALSTAIIGAEKENATIGDLLKIYDERTDEGPNNSAYTRYFLDNFDLFRLNNCFQIVGDDIAVYPKEFFDCPTGNPSMGYSVHHAVGSWRGNYFGNWYVNSCFIWMMRLIIRAAILVMGEWSYAQFRRRRLARQTEFYEIYLKHRKS